MTIIAEIVRELRTSNDPTEMLWANEIERLELENWQLKQACGYPIPADKETPQNPFKCGICDARGFNQPE